MEKRFGVYIAFFMCSIYLSSYVKKQISILKGDRSWEESDYKTLFEFEMKRCADENNLVARSFYGNDLNEDDYDNIAFKKKTKYDYQDFIDYYEKMRFTLPFMVYRAMKWWPTLDIIATYGHLFSNGIMVYIAVNWSVSFFMCFNIICICLFYFMITQKLNKIAKENL